MWCAYNRSEISLTFCLPKFKIPPKFNLLYAQESHVFVVTLSDRDHLTGRYPDAHRRF